MKHLAPHALTLLVLLMPASASSQSAVDRMTRELDSLAMAAFDDWRVSPDLKSYRPEAGDPASPAFDDSAWRLLRLNEHITLDSCWMRKRIVVPATIAGRPVRGALKFLIAVDDYGYLWVNGKSRGMFPWNGEFELTPDARPGEVFTIAIKAVNTGGPLRLLRAEIESAEAAPLKSSIADLALSFRAGQKLLSSDTYQTNSAQRTDPGIDRSRTPAARKRELNDLLQTLAAEVNTAALGAGDTSAFNASLTAVRARLGPIREYARSFTLHFTSNAHIDAAWLWREAETVELTKNTFASVLRMMDARPEFTYTQSSALYYDWMKRRHSDLYERIRRRVREGRWEPIGGMWVEPDCNLPDGESWARQLLYAKRFFRSELQSDITIGWNPDSFGYNGNMPMLYRNAGITAFITQKIGWNDTNVFPHRVFWWESADGSRILSYFPFDYVNTVDNPYGLVDWLRQFEANTGFTRMLVLFGVGDHGGGPSLEMLSRIDRLEKLDIFPAITHGTAGAYLDWIRSQDLSRLPVWKDELYLEYHQGTFTTQAAMKASNRAGETLLINAEKLSSLASLYGRPYNAAALGEAWRMLLFTQFHDILPGSSIREVYADASVTHQEVRSIGEFELRSALGYLAERVNTSGAPGGTPVIVFNSLAWTRTDLATVELPEADENSYAIADARGREVRSQIIRRDRYHRELVFVARDIPAMGYALYSLQRRVPAPGQAAVHAGRTGLDNASFSVAIDTSTGWLSSIRDRRTGRELLDGPGNQLQMLEDLPKAWDAWNIGWTGTVFPTTFRGIEVVEEGPVRTVVRIRHDYLKPGRRKEYPTEDFPTSFFTQDVVLYDGLDRIDFVTAVDWWEDRTMLKVAFPLAIRDTMATYEIPFGSIARSTQMRTSLEQARREVPALRWADVSGGDYGVSLLNTAKYGYDIKGNTLRLSLLRSPKWPDPLADRGKHTISYALYPHAGGWREAGVARRGHEFNTPLVCVVAGRHGGPLQGRHSFVSLEPATLVLSTLRQAEDGDGLIVRWYNTADTEVNAELHLARTPRGVRRTDFLEAAGTELPVAGSRIRVNTPARSVVTLRVTF